MRDMREYTPVGRIPAYLIEPGDLVTKNGAFRREATEVRRSNDSVQVSYATPEWGQYYEQTYPRTERCFVDRKVF
jgi:hypothetical protein